MVDYRRQRNIMLDAQLRSRGITDSRLLKAMATVPREAFVPEHMRALAYQDKPLLIADGQIIHRPFDIALLIQSLQLKGGEKVLDIGTGTGYTAALLAALCDEVFVIEQVGQLAVKAAANLIETGFENVHVLHDSSIEDWIEESPFDAILISERLPAVAQQLNHQLALGGRLVMPGGTHDGLVVASVVERDHEGYSTTAMHYAEIDLA